MKAVVYARLEKLKRLLLRHDLLLATVAAVAVIILGVFLGWYNNRVVPVNPASSAHYTLEPGNHLSFMANWDGPIYLSIAAHGYTALRDTNFFPLYPLLIHIVKLVLGSALDSALLITWLSFAGAIYFYLQIVKRLFNIKDNAVALQGAAFFVFFPTAVFMLATYTESLFACLALAAINYALQKKYLPAAGLVLLCSATHATGMFMVILLGLLLLEQGVTKTKALLAMIIGSLGLVGYMSFLWIKFGQPLAFITSQKSHGWLQGGATGLVASANLPDYIFAALTLAAALYWWPRRKSFSIYALLFLLIPLVGQQFGGFGRYVLMAFPVQLMCYDYLRHKRTSYSFALVLFGVGWAYFMLQYAGGYVGG